jgi:hypothetical protein
MNATTSVAGGRGTYLLYVDLLGSGPLVDESGGVDGLCGIIDSLDAHNHDAFDTVVFSDTAVVYSTVLPAGIVARRHLVTYLCEFAQELLCRLVGRGLHLRAYLARGAFNHGRLENVEAFQGETLARAPARERDPMHGSLHRPRCSARLSPLRTSNLTSSRDRIR